MKSQETVDVPDGTKTPNGGVTATVFYRDAQGNPADKSVAVSCEIVEFNAKGKEVGRTYGSIRH